MYVRVCINVYTCVHISTYMCEMMSHDVCMCVCMTLGEEVSQLQKGMTDFSGKLSQIQTQLEVTQREKSMLMSKSLELERLHVQIKEQMGADINYLRQLNLQMVERQVKG